MNLTVSPAAKIYFEIMLAAVLTVVIIILTILVLRALKKRRDEARRANWGEGEWARARTVLVGDIYSHCSGQLLDVKEKTIRKSTELGDDYEIVLELLKRDRYIIDQPLISGKLIHALFPNSGLGISRCLRLTPEGRNSYKLAKAEGVFLAENPGQGVTIFNGSIQRVQLNINGSTGSQG